MTCLAVETAHLPSPRLGNPSDGEGNAGFAEDGVLVANQ
jgi:hypothetical protein